MSYVGCHLPDSERRQESGQRRNCVGDPEEEGGVLWSNISVVDHHPRSVQTPDERHCDCHDNDRSCRLLAVEIPQTNAQ